MAASVTSERDWFIVGRWQEFEGEGRANLLRIVAIGAFYSVHLAMYRGWAGMSPLSQSMPADAAQRFHGSVTALAVAWLMLALAILVCLQRRVFPGGLKYFSTVADACFLTGVLSVADGPRSPLVVGYFLVIVLATLRFSLHLIWLSTGLSLAGYLFLLGYARWYRPEIAIPRYHQLIFVLGLGLTGIMLGQVIRRVRVMATEYAARRQGHGQSPAE